VRHQSKRGHRQAAIQRCLAESATGHDAQQLQGRRAVKRGKGHGKRNVQGAGHEAADQDVANLVYFHVVVDRE
jgi:hypothetical protein